MDSYWSPATPHFSSYFDTNLHVPTQSLQFEHETEDNVFDQASEESTWTPAHCEEQDHQLDGFMLPDSFDQQLVHSEVALCALRFVSGSPCLIFN